MASTSRLTLADFRRSEGPALRAQKLHALWKSLPTLPEPSERPTPTQMVKLPGQDTIGILSPERAERLRRLYLEELSRRVSLQERPEARLWGGADDLTEPELQQQHQQQQQQQQQHHHQKKGGKGIAWKDFRKFLWDQEKELWDIFHDLDRDGDGKLDVAEMRNALQRSGKSSLDHGQGHHGHTILILATHRHRNDGFRFTGFRLFPGVGVICQSGDTAATKRRDLYHVC
jgi:solute carrier family 25 phosphate transporter 23/24/25/41